MSGKKKKKISTRTIKKALLFHLESMRERFWDNEREMEKLREENRKIMYALTGMINLTKELK